MSEPWDDDRLVAVMSTLASVPPPADTGTRVRARARQMIEAQRSRRSVRGLLPVLVTGALSLASAAYFGAALMQALHSYRELW